MRYSIQDPLWMLAHTTRFTQAIRGGYRESLDSVFGYPVVRRDLRRKAVQSL